jgi:hypothetical protein
VPTAGEIVAVHRHIERSRGYRNASDVGNVGGKPVSENYASGGDAQQHKIGSLGGSLDDFVSDTPKSSVDI